MLNGIPHLARSRKQFENDGYFVTEPLFDAATFQNLRGEFDRLWQEEIRSAEKCEDATHRELTKLRPFIGHVHTRSDAVKQTDLYPLSSSPCPLLLEVELLVPIPLLVPP